MAESKHHLKPVIISELTRHGIKSRACRAAGISRQTLSRWVAADPAFKKQVEAAMERGAR